MVISNGEIFTSDGNFSSGSLHISGNKIAEIQYGNSDISHTEQVIDATGLYVIPGLVDIHLHGAAGYDFCDGTAEAFEKISQYELSRGVTSIVPTTMTLPAYELERIVQSVSQYAANDSSIKGITLEGPFISPEKKGAQNERHIKSPDEKLFYHLQNISQGLIRQVTVAPEAEGAVDFISQVKDSCVVSLAHTAATYSEAMSAFKTGANHVTHLYNAMLPFNHREPGVIGAVFDSENTYAELICDGEHISPSVVRATFKLLGAGRLCMISDSMSATGMPDGEYTLGGQNVIKSGHRATLKDGTLAGSVASLYDCLKTAVLDMGIPLADAIKSCTITPAKSLGIDNICGTLSQDASADILLLDKSLDIRYVIKDGEIVYSY